MFCSKCGAQLPDKTRYCSGCGFNVGGQVVDVGDVERNAVGTRDDSRSRSAQLVFPSTPPRSPHIAWLALIQPGLPHIVFGQTSKGIALIAAFWLSVPTMIGPLVILILSIVDAYNVGNTLKAGRPVSKWAFFPKP